MKKPKLFFSLFLVSLLSSCTLLSTSSVTITPTTHPDLDSLKLQASQITLSLQDIPADFTESSFESDQMLKEENLLDVQSAFSFQTNKGNLQKVIGMVTTYPYSQRAITDDTGSLHAQTELLSRSLAKGIVFTKNVAVQNLVLDTPVGDVYSGKTFAWSNEDIGFPDFHTRTQLLVFERNKITVTLFFQYVEEFPTTISIDTLAHALDKQILDFDS